MIESKIKALTKIVKATASLVIELISLAGLIQILVEVVKAIGS